MVYREFIVGDSNMMNYVDYFLSQVTLRIPREILETTFCPRGQVGKLPITVEYAIRSEVITKHFLKDLNLLGGQQTTIPLANVSHRGVDNGIIFELTPRDTGGREIMAVMSVTSGYDYVNGGQTLSPIADAFGPSGGGYATSRTHLVGKNTVFVEYQSGSAFPLNLYAILDNAIDFSNIQRGSIPKLGNMVVLLTQALIYTKARISVENAAVINGSSLGAYATIIDSYADSYEEYRELRDTTLQKLLTFSDSYSINRFNRMISAR